MGNYYYCFCLNCHEDLFLGKAGEFPGEKTTMKELSDFLLAHVNHILKFGGDEFDCAYDFNGKPLIEMS